MEHFRNRVDFYGYEVYQVVGSEAPWRVRFYAGGEEAGGGQYQTAEEADEAGVNYMFQRWGDDE